MWHEYLHGLGNNKAVKEFTQEEWGDVKQKYSKKKIFWDIICNLLPAGFTEVTVIGKVFQVYGMSHSVIVCPQT